jgi:dTDP-4-amino-4,6-dideoxygalactose transaminase
LGAKYAIGVTSCTAGIFLALKYARKTIRSGTIYAFQVYCDIPTLSTTRFIGAFIHAGAVYRFTDNTEWVGNDYELYSNPDITIVDSAQRFDPNQFKDYSENTIAIFSNYPTKPLGGNRGGFIVSNKPLDWIRQAAYFGENFSINSWEGTPGFVGWQMYMDSIQAYFVNESLDRYHDKRHSLLTVRGYYKHYSNLEVVTGDSFHLFRVRVKDNQAAMEALLKKGIQTGIHYRCAHLDPVYGKPSHCPESEKDAKTVLSIPFHEDLTDKEINKVIKSILEL